MPRSSGLGKGLSSIIPTADLTRESTAAGDIASPFLAEVEVASIRPNPNQPRVHFDEQSLLELSSSIAEMGVLQPVLVRRLDSGAYELIAGERRWRAAQRAGLATVPAIVRTADNLNSIEQALVENLHRQDLTPLEEAAAYQQLIEDFQLTHEQLSSRVGKSRSAITNTVRLLGLPPAVQHRSSNDGSGDSRSGETVVERRVAATRRPSPRLVVTAIPKVVWFPVSYLRCRGRRPRCR